MPGPGQHHQQRGCCISCSYFFFSLYFPPTSCSQESYEAPSSPLWGVNKRTPWTTPARRKMCYLSSNALKLDGVNGVHIRGISECTQLCDKMIGNCCTKDAQFQSNSKIIFQSFQFKIDRNKKGAEY